jgi:hypothetical protein
VNKRLVLFSCCIVATCWIANAQTSVSALTGPRVSLTEQAVAQDVSGQPVLTARLRSTDLHATPDSPITDVRLVVSNSSPSVYTYVAGWATFYDADGVRCGEGLFKVNALTPGEAAETDTPGIRLVCSPSTWRILVTSLLTNSGGTANPALPSSASASSAAPMPAPPPAPANIVQALVLSIDGEVHPIQIGNPIVIRTGTKSITLVLKQAQ